MYIVHMCICTHIYACVDTKKYIRSLVDSETLVEIPYSNNKNPSNLETGLHLHSLKMTTPFKQSKTKEVAQRELSCEVPGDEEGPVCGNLCWGTEGS